MKNKGFTLIEILAVIIIIGLLAIIAIPVVNKYIQNSKNKTYESYIQNIRGAVDNMYIDCAVDSTLGCSYPTASTPVLITLKDLIDKGYSDELRVPNSTKLCDSNKSYVFVNKKNEENTSFNYVVCFECASYVSKANTCLEYEDENW